MSDTGAAHRCPAKAIHLCPLYIASHTGLGGCVDDMAMPCRVSRGEVSYHEALSDAITANIRRRTQELMRHE